MRLQPRTEIRTIPGEVALNHALVAGLGLPPEVWLALTVLLCFSVFFKFGRFWSVRNLDLMLLFAHTPGLLLLVGRGEQASWWAFVWLFAGTLLWLARCMLDLGFTRRPLLEPNLNNGGLGCFVLGLLGLVLVETTIFEEPHARPRNPGDPHAQEVINASTANSTDTDRPTRGTVQTLRRWLATLGHLGIVTGLIVLGWQVFGRPAIGLAMALCYLVLPYSRIALLDSGQLVPAALIVLALAQYRRPALVGALIGAAAAWMPAALGLIPLWAGFYWRRGASRFLLLALTVVGAAVAISILSPDVTAWARSLGARRLSEAGLLASSEAPSAGSFWAGVEPAYRLPVFVLYVAFVVATAIWPVNKNLGQLMALSAASLLASQFWYLDEGGTMVALYLPLILAVVFRPNLAAIRPAIVTRRGPGGALAG